MRLRRPFGSLAEDAAAALPEGYAACQAAVLDKAAALLRECDGDRRRRRTDAAKALCRAAIEAEAAAALDLCGEVAAPGIVTRPDTGQIVRPKPAVEMPRLTVAPAQLRRGLVHREAPSANQEAPPQGERGSAWPWVLGVGLGGFLLWRYYR